MILPPATISINNAPYHQKVWSRRDVFSVAVQRISIPKERSYMPVVWVGPVRNDHQLVFFRPFSTDAGRWTSLCYACFMATVGGLQCGG